MQKDPPNPAEHEEKIRAHSYDGIQEYDKRLPNWWLYTLYGTIIFSAVYWFAFRHSSILGDDMAQVDASMSRIAAAKLASSIDVKNDDLFWEMSRNRNFVAAGQQTYTAMCAACHLPSLRGKSENPTAVGPDLTDLAWIHGGTPKEIYHTVSAGVLAKGMPAWEPVLGQKKTAELVAYILSLHSKEELTAGRSGAP